MHIINTLQLSLHKVIIATSKRKYVSSQTQVHFRLNASAFEVKTYLRFKQVIKPFLKMYIYIIL